MSQRILVIGSTNVDLIVKTDRLPLPGETVIGGTFAQAKGGKGANQAVAAARSGAEVTFLTAVGDDTYGPESLAALEREGIDTSCSKTVPGYATGIALITVDVTGENCIVVAPGANATLGPNQIETAFSKQTDLAVCVCQLETPIDGVERAMHMARKSGITTILDPAPAAALKHSLLSMTDCVTPNARETEALTGIFPDTIASAISAAGVLFEQGVRTVIITLGVDGAVLVDEFGSLALPAPKVTAVDTTAAGDAFTGCLGAVVAKGYPFRKALPYALCAGALSVTTVGAQPSIPNWNDLNALKGKVFGLDD